MNHRKLSLFIAVCITVSAGISGINVNASAQPVKLQTKLPTENNLSPLAFVDKTLPTIDNVKISSSSNSSSSKASDKITTGTSINLTNQVLSEVTLYSDNANKDYANTNNTVTLKFTSFHPLAKNPTVKINGVSVNITNLASNTYTATYSLTNPLAEGPITFSIDDLEDVLGAKSTKSVTSVTSGNEVNFYNSSPTISNVFIDSKNSSKSAKNGTTIRLNFTSNRQLDLQGKGSPVIKIFNQLIKPESITYANSTYTASYVLKDSDPEGYIDFEMSNLTDLAGNVNQEIIKSVSIDKNIKHDKTPVAINNITFTSNNSNPNLARPNDTVVLEFDTDGTQFITSTVNIDGHKVPAIKKFGTNHYKAEFTLGSSTEEGFVIYDLNGVTDEAGNVGVPSLPSDASVFFDKTAPTFSDISIKSNKIVGNNSYGNVSDNVNLTFTSSEKLAADQLITINGKSCSILLSHGNVYSANYTLNQNDAEGNVKFKISSLLDIVGNASEVYTATTDNSSVFFDKTSPVINISGVIDNEFNNHPATKAVITFYDRNFDPTYNKILLNGNDVSSNIKKNNDGLYTYVLNATSEGKYIINAYSKDFSQNVSMKTLTFNIDRTIPVINFNVNTPYVNRVFTPIVTTDLAEDNVFEVYINDVLVNPQKLPTLLINKKYTIKARSKDKAGNISKITSTTFVLDTIRPKINVSGLIQSFFYSNNVNPNITFEDANLLRSTMTLNGAPYNNNAITKDGVYNLKIFSVDAAENSNEQLIHFIIDKSTPSIEFKYPLNNKTFNKMIKPILITQSKYGLDSISMFLDGEIYHGEDISTEGKHSIVITAKNKSGTATKKTFTFFIKTTPPLIRITNVEDGKIYKAGITPEIYKEEAIDYKMTLNDKPYKLGQAINSYGAYTLVIKATDTADNLATKVIHFSVASKKLATIITSPRSSLPLIGGFIVICIAGVLGFFKFKSKKVKTS